MRGWWHFWAFKAFCKLFYWPDPPKLGPPPNPWFPYPGCPWNPPWWWGSWYPPCPWPWWWSNSPLWPCPWWWCCRLRCGTGTQLARNAIEKSTNATEYFILTQRFRTRPHQTESFSKITSNVTEPVSFIARTINSTWECIVNNTRSLNVSKKCSAELKMMRRSW